MRYFSTRPVRLLAFAMLLGCAPLPAAAQHADLLLSINGADPTRIDTGLIDFGVEIEQVSGHVAHEIEVPVFVGSGLAGEADLEPGIIAEESGGFSVAPNANFSPGESIGFDFVSFHNPQLAINGNLFYWDFNTDLTPTWQSAPAGTTLSWAHDPGAAPLTGSASVDGSDSDVTGFEIDTTNGNGGIHRHVDTLLTGPGGEPPIGIYLAAAQFETATAQSDPLFLLAGTVPIDFGSGDPLIDEEDFEEFIEAAEEWVEDNYDTLIGAASTGGVPEPATAMLVLVMGAALFPRRRRSRNS